MAPRAKREEVREEVIDTAGWENWLTVEQVAEESGCSVRTVYRKVKSGEIRRYVTPGGYRFKPEDLDRIAEIIEDDERKDIREANAALIEKLGGIVDTLTSSNHKMTELILEHTNRISAAASKQLEQAHTRIEKLEQGNIKMLELREEMLSELHARELATEEVRAKERRKDAALETLKSQIAPLLTAYVSNRNPLEPKLQAVLEVMNGIDPQVWGFLLHPETEFLNAEQKAKLKTILPETVVSNAITTPLDTVGETEKETGK